MIILQRERQCSRLSTCNNVLENASEVRVVTAVGLLQQFSESVDFWLAQLSDTPASTSMSQQFNLSFVK